MSPASRQRGFTLPELAIAGGIAAFLMLVAWELLLQGAEIKAESEARTRMNTQARQNFEMLLYGGKASGGAGGNDGTGEVRGIATGEALPAGTLREQFRLRVESNGLTIRGDETGNPRVTCTGPGEPLPDCTSAGAVLSVNGQLAADPALESATRSVSGHTVETGISVADPWQAARPNARPGSAVEDYRTIIMRMNEGDG